MKKEGRGIVESGGVGMNLKSLCLTVAGSYSTRGPRLEINSNDNNNGLHLADTSGHRSLLK